MPWIAILGVIALIFGLLLLFSPQSLIRMSDGLNRMVIKVDEQAFKYRIGVGVSFLIASLFLFFYAYMLGLV